MYVSATYAIYSYDDPGNAYNTQCQGTLFYSGMQDSSSCNSDPFSQSLPSASPDLILIITLCVLLPFMLCVTLCILGYRVAGSITHYFQPKTYVYVLSRPQQQPGSVITINNSTTPPGLAQNQFGSEQYTTANNPIQKATDFSPSAPPTSVMRWGKVVD